MTNWERTFWVCREHKVARKTAQEIATELWDDSTTGGVGMLDRQAAGFMTQNEAATKLGISTANWRSSVARGVIDPPTRRIQGSRRRYYNDADLQHIKNSPLPKKGIANHAEQRRKEGFYSKSDIARMCGVAVISVDYWVKKKFGAPTHPHKAHVGNFYNQQEADEFKAFMDARKNFPSRKFGRTQHGVIRDWL
jgi:hypothetical protein